MLSANDDVYPSSPDARSDTSEYVSTSDSRYPHPSDDSLDGERDLERVEVANDLLGDLDPEILLPRRPVSSSSWSPCPNPMYDAILPKAVVDGRMGLVDGEIKGEVASPFGLAPK